MCPITQPGAPSTDFEAMYFLVKKLKPHLSVRAPCVIVFVIMYVG